MILTKFYKGMRPEHISQTFHAKHQALDIVAPSMTPLCAPEDCVVLGIRGDGFTPSDHKNQEHGYGIRLKGKETGYEYLYWHCQPYFPVWGGDSVKRGQIVAFMHNSGNVYKGGKYVPLEKRNTAPYPGTHLHVEVYEGSGRNNPLSLINWFWEPQYTIVQLIGALMAMTRKALTVSKS